MPILKSSSLTSLTLSLNLYTNMNAPQPPYHSTYSHSVCDIKPSNHHTPPNYTTLHPTSSALHLTVSHRTTSHRITSHHIINFRYLNMDFSTFRPFVPASFTPFHLSTIVCPQPDPFIFITSLFFTYLPCLTYCDIISSYVMSCPSIQSNSIPPFLPHPLHP